MIAFEMPRNIQLAVPHKTTHCNWYSLRTVYHIIVAYPTSGAF